MASILPGIMLKDPELDFEILKQIGIGGYGQVYKAKVVKNDQLCALKIIKIKPGENFDAVQQEISILSECKHPNIVGYLASYLRKDKLWIALEFCGLGSLFKIIHSHGAGLNELQIAFVCREALQGLTYLHEKNKIHRDIKGANILMTEDGDVKLADFGIAAQLSKTLEKRRTFIGTPYWMAPEVTTVEKKGGYNKQCDIWSIGITAIELAEMKPPLYDLHPMRVLYLMSKRNYHPPTLQHKNKWSDNFHSFLSQALKKDPLRRPTARELLKHEFVNRDLSRLLMVPLLRAVEAEAAPAANSEVVSPEKSASREKKSSFRKRISSVSTANGPEMAIHGLALPPKKDPSLEPLPAWLEAAAEEYEEPPHSAEEMIPERRLVQSDGINTSPLHVTEQTLQGKGSRAHLSKIFNGCPLNLHCASSWIHPVTQVHYVLLGAEEGLFYLKISSDQSQVIEQVSHRSCHWLRVVENVVMWLSRSHRVISMTNLILLFQSKQQETNGHRSRGHTVKIPESKDCETCCIVHNSISDETYLLVAVPKKGILLMQWYSPRHAFMYVKEFECSLPPLNVFEAFVVDNEQYPIVCVGVSNGGNGNLQFDTININTKVCSLKGAPTNDDIIELQQIEDDSILVATHYSAKFVDISGSCCTESNGGQIKFQKEMESVFYLPNCVLGFHKHGMQAVSIATHTVTAEVVDNSRAFHLLSSDGSIIIKTNKLNDETSSNLYILEPEGTNHF